MPRMSNVFDDFIELCVGAISQLALCGTVTSLRLSCVVTCEKKEERKEIRETKKEKKNIVIHFVCLCLRFFAVQNNLQEFNHRVQQTAERNRLKYSCKNFIRKHIRSI